MLLLLLCSRCYTFPHCDNLFYLPFIFPPPLLVGSIAGPYSGNSSLFGQRTLTYNSSISLHWQSTTTALTRVAGCPFSFPTYRSSLFIWEKHCRPSLLLLFQSTEPLTSYFLLPGGPSRCGQEKPVTCVYLRLDRPPFNTRQHPVIHRSINWGRTGLEDVYIYTGCCPMQPLLLSLAPIQTRRSSGNWRMESTPSRSAGWWSRSILVSCPCFFATDGYERERDIRGTSSGMFVWCYYAASARRVDTSGVVYARRDTRYLRQSLSRTQPRYIDALKKKKKKEEEEKRD